MSELAQVANEGMLTRRGNRYSPTTGERVTVLQPDGENADLAYSYPSLPALVDAVKDYDGNVTAISGSTYTRLKQVDEGATDFFVGRDGTYTRSDKWGTVTAALENMKPDWSGAVATGEVGPDAPTAPTTGTPTPAPSGFDYEFQATGQQIKSGNGPTPFITLYAGKVTRIRQHIKAGSKDPVGGFVNLTGDSVIFLRAENNGRELFPRTDMGVAAHFDYHIFGTGGTGLPVDEGVIDMEVEAQLRDGVGSQQTTYEHAPPGR